MTTPTLPTTLKNAALVVAVLSGFYLTSLYSYLMFHTFVELFCVIVAFGIFTIAWNSRETMENDYLLFIGIGYLFVGATDVLHTLTYKNMIDLAGFSSDLPTQLWIAGRYLDCLTVLCAPAFTNRKLNAQAALAGFATIFILMIAAIFYWRVFPACFVEGAGLTTYKVASEYVIALLLAVSIVLLRMRRDSFDPAVLRQISWSIVFSICAEMSFTLYTDVYGFSNMIGHLFKLVSYYLVYKAIVETGLRRPYDLMYRCLKESEANLAIRARELEAANKKLESVNQELEAFSYTVSHDLRSPLSNITCSCMAIMQDGGSCLTEKSKEFLGYIERETGRMSGLIRTLLQFSRVGSQDLQRQETDLSAMARKIALELQRGEPQRQVEVAVHRGIRAECDDKLLYIVLVNLMGNAWKYTRDKKYARIEVGVIETRGSGVLFVKDNGAGFDMGQSHRLFGTFQRLHGAEYEGVGIGLATVYRIIERHGGKIWAEGKVGEGATFYFTLGAEIAAISSPEENVQVDGAAGNRMPAERASA